MRDWLHMGGYGFYVWSSYGMLALAVVVELIALRQRRRAAQRQADELRAEQSSRHPEQPLRPPEQSLRPPEQSLRPHFRGNPE